VLCETVNCLFAHHSVHSGDKVDLTLEISREPGWSVGATELRISRCRTSLNQLSFSIAEVKSMARSQRTSTIPRNTCHWSGSMPSSAVEYQ
jgi:hypothetical protein